MFGLRKKKLEGKKIKLLRSAFFLKLFSLIKKNRKTKFSAFFHSLSLVFFFLSFLWHPNIIKSIFLEFFFSFFHTFHELDIGFWYAKLMVVLVGNLSKLLSLVSLSLNDCLL